MNMSFSNYIAKFDDFVSLGKATDEEIFILEEQLQLTFSDEYKDYLKNCRLACANGHEFTGICDTDRLNVVKATLCARNEDTKIPSKWYVIEKLGVDGIIVWQAPTGEIYYSSLDMDMVKRCDSLYEYVKE